MDIPSSFKNKIRETFYDKPIILCTKTEITDSEGWVSESLVESETIMGNVQFGNKEAIREEYGIEDSVDIVITTNKSLENNSVVSYQDEYYTIIKSIPFDSHIKLIGKRYGEGNYSQDS